MSVIITEEMCESGFKDALIELEKKIKFEEMTPLALEMVLDSLVRKQIVTYELEEDFSTFEPSMVYHIKHTRAGCAGEIVI